MYSTYLGLKGGAGVAADGWGQAYVTGGNVLAARLNRAGSKLLSAFWALGGNAIALDRSGYAYITGETYSHLLPTFNAYQPTLSWGLDSARSKDDAFLVKISDAPAPPPTAEETDGRIVYTGTWQSVTSPVFSGGRAVSPRKPERQRRSVLLVQAYNLPAAATTTPVSPGSPRTRDPGAQ